MNANVPLPTTSVQVEKEKDKLNRRATLLFVEKHKAYYRAALDALMKLPPHANILRIQCCNTDHLDGNESVVSPMLVGPILSRLPLPVLHLSDLTTVDYKSAHSVAVPIFDDNGRWQYQTQLVDEPDFPGVHHPSRILCGGTYKGHTIWPLALPKSVSQDDEARSFYQLHVLLHEFFHTIRVLGSSPDLRRKVVLARHQMRFTFKEWCNLWEIEFVSNKQWIFPSYYAATYADQLTLNMKELNPVSFERALTEQMCESFAGYMLGIAPNEAGVCNFRKHSPGAWSLMHHLATAEVVEK